MLILNRKIGERIIIAGSIVVSVLEINGRRVRLGIEAPSEVDIRREELEPRNRQANELVATSTENPGEHRG
jgi:carbon storage regulator